MKTTYYKDTIRSYMIIECPAEAETKGYQYRMLEMNRIEGLLSCGIRHIDGIKYLYYDITGKQSLQALYESRKIPGSELFKLLRSIDAVSESLSGFLLDEQQLVLAAEQIYYDFRSGSYWFTYYPGSAQNPEVFRFLADGIDGTDKRAAAAAYRLCSLAGGSRLALREALREEAAEETRSRDPYFNEAVTSGGAPEREAKILPEKRYEKEAEVTLDNRYEKEVPEGSDKEKRPVWQIAIRILFIVLLSSGAGGLIAVQYFVYISQRERRLCIAGTVLLVIAAVMLTAETVLRCLKRRREKIEEEKKRTPVYMKSDEAVISASTAGESKESYMIAEDNNTVRFSEQDTAGRLYGRDRGNRIDLRTLPVTVGKAQAYADVILEDPSVSRIHARIYRGEEGGVEIRDLGSTNGTFINGIRIPPNEKSPVHRGDEVKFGTLEYEYR